LEYCVEKNLATLVDGQALNMPSLGSHDTNKSFEPASKLPMIIFHKKSQKTGSRFETNSYLLMLIRTFQAGRPGTDVTILKIFLPKKLAKKLPFLNQNKAKLYKNLIITLVFDKKSQYFSQKIVEKRRKL
jgi:hypothetical protein